MKHHIQVVTTCSAVGWAETGKKMAESFVERWPTACLPLVVYAEGFWPEEPGVEARRLPTWLQDFKTRHEGDARANGRGKGGYNWRFDAVKFAHKVAAVEDAAKKSSAEFLIWMDADTFTHAPVNEEWLRRLLPKDEALAWLDRIGFHPECGFLIFNLLHKDGRHIIDAWKRLYWRDGVFGLPETHDSFVLEHVVKQMRAPWKSLSGAGRRTFHPAATGPLAECFDHLKGDRKRLPFSPEHRILAS